MDSCLRRNDKHQQSALIGVNLRLMNNSLRIRMGSEAAPYVLFTIYYCFLRSSAVDFFVNLRNTIFQNVVFYARFLFWPIVTFVFVAFYEAFL